MAHLLDFIQNHDVETVLITLYVWVDDAYPLACAALGWKGRERGTEPQRTDSEVLTLVYYSHDLEKAKVQLAAVSALMDDIEPHDPTSPPIIHVVSYSEASHLADPPVINESIQITRAAIEEYRRWRARGEVEDMSRHPEVLRRTEELLDGARSILDTIESVIPNPYTAEGLYRIFAAGFLPVPYLWECRDEFQNAVQWRTRLIKGGVKTVDENGSVIPPAERARMVADTVCSGPSEPMSEGILLGA